MNNTQAVLAAMSRMQSNAQAALPVSPNNGNPGGAYNMPHGGQQAQPAAPSDPWPWLQPSPFMQSLQQDLASRSERLRQELSSTTVFSPQIAPAVAPAPAVPAPSQVAAPMPTPSVGSVLRNMVTNQPPLSTPPAAVQRTGSGGGDMANMPVLPVRAFYRTT